jgi:hypothetical protein
VPYLLTADPARAERYRVRFAGTHSFLPARHGLTPHTLHVAFHCLVASTLVLLALLMFRAA